MRLARIVIHILVSLLSGPLFFFLFRFLIYYLIKFVLWYVSPPPNEDVCSAIALVAAWVIAIVAPCAMLAFPYRDMHGPKNTKPDMEMIQRHIRREQEAGRIRPSARYQMSIDADGFTVAIEVEEATETGDYSGQCQHRARWSAVDSLEETERHVFLTVRKVGTIMVPAAAFVDKEEFHKFVGAVKGYLRPGPAREGITSLPPEGIVTRNSSSFGTGE
jgi:hypothetical protein